MQSNFARLSLTWAYPSLSLPCGRGGGLLARVKVSGPGGGRLAPTLCAAYARYAQGNRFLPLRFSLASPVHISAL